MSRIKKVSKCISCGIHEPASTKYYSFIDVITDEGVDILVDSKCAMCAVDEWHKKKYPDKICHYKGCTCYSEEGFDFCEDHIPNVPSVSNSVNSPSHYNDGKIEVIDYIEDQKLGFHLGNAIKYISRAGKKDPAKIKEDLEKAKWYIDRYIKNL